MRRALSALATGVAAVLAVGGSACRSMSAYEGLLDPVAILEGRLDPCPQSPNCVSSQAWDASQRVEPLPYAGDGEEALDRLAAIIEEHPRAEVTARKPGYLHAAFRSKVFRFVDDVDLVLDPHQPVVHVRSASRLGYSDLGVNRERVEWLREAFERGALVPIQ